MRYLTNFKETKPLEELLKTNFVIKIDSEEKAIILLKKLKKYNVQWLSRRVIDPIEDNCWEYYKKNTHYYYRSESGLTYGSAISVSDFPILYKLEDIL